jgi:hypothetical protein
VDIGGTEGPDCCCGAGDGDLERELNGTLTGVDPRDAIPPTGVDPRDGVALPPGVPTGVVPAGGGVDARHEEEELISDPQLRETN